MSRLTWPDLPNESNMMIYRESRREEEARLCKMVMATLEKEFADWETKDFIVRSTLRKNFIRYTDMPIEEMIGRLKKLEDAIQKQSSTSEFVETLRKLATYQHTCYLYSETELLVNMMVEDLNKMLQECFSTSYSEQKQTLQGSSEDSSSVQEKAETVKRERSNLPRYI